MGNAVCVRDDLDSKCGTPPPQMVIPIVATRDGIGPASE